MSNSLALGMIGFAAGYLLLKAYIKHNRNKSSPRQDSSCMKGEDALNTRLALLNPTPQKIKDIAFEGENYIVLIGDEILQQEQYLEKNLCIENTLQCTAAQEIPVYNFAQPQSYLRDLKRQVQEAHLTLQSRINWAKDDGVVFVSVPNRDFLDEPRWTSQDAKQLKLNYKKLLDSIEVVFPRVKVILVIYNQPTTPFSKEWFAHLKAWCGVKKYGCLFLCREHQLKPQADTQPQAEAETCPQTYLSHHPFHLTASCCYTLYNLKQEILNNEHIQKKNHGPHKNQVKLIQGYFS